MPHRHRAEDISTHDSLPANERRVFTRGYLLGNAFELWIALAAILTALTYFYDPAALTDSSVGRVAHPIAFTWNTGYLTAGVLITTGLWRPSPRLELAGLSLFSSAVLINAVAIVAVRGSAAIGVVFTYVGLAAASAMRAYLVMKLNRAWHWA